MTTDLNPSRGPSLLLSQDLPAKGRPKYWARRSDLVYYEVLDLIMRSAAADAASVIDVGSNGCPYLDWFYWIPERVSVDIRKPYRSETVVSYKGDIHKLAFPKRFDVCTCLQVLEHVPDVVPFARRLLELADLLIVSVPYRWPENANAEHVHDPVDEAKLLSWFGTAPSYSMVVTEPFESRKAQRLIALYDSRPDRRYDGAVLRDRRPKDFRARLAAG